MGLERSIITVRKTRDFRKQVMGADAESHRPTLGGAQGVLRGIRRKDLRNQRGQGHQENTAHRIN